MKKGEITLSTTGQIILAVIGLLVVLGAIYFMYVRVTSRSYDKAACQLSVVANAKVRTPVTNTELWTLDCPTRYVRFTKTGYIEESGKTSLKVPFRKGNKRISLETCERGRSGYYEECPYLEQVNKVISERIMDCWEQFMAGQVSVFSNYNTQRQCVICTVIEFDEDVKKEFGEVYSSEILPEEQSLDEYMRTHGPIGRDITYYEYTQDPIDHFNPEYFDYNFDQSYAIVFTAINGQYFESIKDMLGEGFDYVMSLLTKEEYEGKEPSRFLNVLHYIEQDYVTQECDTLVDA